MAIPNIVPRNNNDGETLGTVQKQWSNVYTNDVTVNGVALVGKLNAIDTSLESHSVGIAALDTNKADKSDTYTKANVDSIANTKADKTDTYTKAEVDSIASGKANQSTTYSKTEVNGLVDAKLDTLVYNTDKANVYSKTEVDNIASGKLDKNQGANNANKVLTVSADGSVVPSDSTGIAITNVANDLNTLAGTSEIVASGDDYIRWANGLQICYGSGSYVKTGAVITFPQAFASLPRILATTDVSSSFAGTSAQRLIIWIGNKSTTGFTLYQNTDATSNSYYKCWFAIGRWK